MGMRVEFGDLKISQKSKDLVNKLLDSNWISGGPIIKEFEDKWGETFDYKNNIAVSNGTDADIASCMALYDFGAQRGDEIIAPALGFIAVGNSILAAGFRPVFADIERETLNVNPSKIEEKITPKTRAIMSVHTMGKPSDMEIINEIANAYGLKVIEDCCEAHGAMYKGQYVGHFGHAAAFSFYVAHVVSAGDGGMVSTNDDGFAEAIQSVKDHGRKPGTLYFDHIRHGLNLRMNGLIAAVGLPEVENFHEIFNKRKDNLNYLLASTKDLEEFADFSREEPHEVISPHAFPVTLKNPKLNFKKFYRYLQDNSINCKRNFGSISTQHTGFEFLGHKQGDFPEAEYVGNNGLHFGIHQFLTRDDLDYASEVLHEYFKGC